jgi:DNA transposition AAA+ family ATPase
MRTNLVFVAKFYTNDDLMKLLKERVEQSSAAQVASELGISHPSLSVIVNGKKPVTPRIAEWLLNREVEAERVFRVA